MSYRAFGPFITIVPKDMTNSSCVASLVIIQSLSQKKWKDVHIIGHGWTIRVKNVGNYKWLLRGRYHGNRTPETEDNRAKSIQETHTDILRYVVPFCQGCELNSKNKACLSHLPLIYHQERQHVDEKLTCVTIKTCAEQVVSDRLASFMQGVLSCR